jgi:membrane protein
MSKIWTLSGLSWRQLAKRVWEQINEDDVFGRAAQLSYYFLLALFPLLLFLITLLGYLAGAGSQIRVTLLRYLGTVMPWSALDLVSKTIDEISSGAGGGKLSFGLVAALWAASNGMTAITDTLNVAYDVKETRPWWKVRLVAIVLTVMLALMIILALSTILLGGKLADFIAAAAGLGNTFIALWKILQWLVVLVFVLVTFGLIYYFAPNLAQRKWYWVTPGSLTAVVLWLLVSFAFRIYLHFFNSYSVTYGSLGALIILMLWFYFTGAAILIGGEVNAEIECAAKPFPRHKHSPQVDRQWVGGQH